MHSVTYKTDNLIKLNYHQTEGISYTDQQWVFSPMVMVNKAVYYDITIYEYTLGREGQTVDFQVSLKNSWMHHKVFLEMLNVYSNARFDEHRSVWLKNKLLNKLHQIYYSALVEHPDSVTNGLIEFDELIDKCNHHFFLDSNNEIVLNHKFPIKFVKIWRETYKRIDNDWRIRMWKLILVLKNIIKDKL